ncbi:MAG: glycosyltransferase [Candidatus Gracilibacteria bacterium]|nr:glycosyltransferase [Candidatus Gracilibacteria bacterium]
MKIGLDLRFLKKGDYYSNFVFKLVQVFINNEKINTYNIYLDLPFSHINFGEHTNNIVIKEKPGSLFEQASFLKNLNKDDNDLTIFFDYNKPTKYKGKNIIFLANLVDFHYPPKKSIFRKYFDNYLLNTNSKNASKIICFNELTKNEINDKLNIYEDNIKIITPFFNQKEKKKELEVGIDIRTKFNIKGEYLIYSAGTGTYKNLDRVIKVFSEIKKANIDLNLVFIDDDSIKDLSLRKNIIENKILDKMYLIGNVSESEKLEFHKNSLGVIFPPLYESFPFLLEDAINYNTPIISSNLKNINNIFGDKIEYFNPTNNFDIYEKIVALTKNKKIPNYCNILKTYNIAETYKELIKAIK